MATSHADAAQNAAADAVVDLIDAGSGAGYIEIRTGSAPADCDSAATGTLLVTLTFGDPAFGSASSGVATANAITSGTCVADGTAGYGRVYDSDDNPIFQGTCGTSGEQFNFSSLSFLTNNEVSLTSMTYTVAAS